MFVMVFNTGQNIGRRIERGEKFDGFPGMLLDDGPVGSGQHPFFINESVANPNLSDIMEIGGNLKFVSFFRREGKPDGNKIRIVADPVENGLRYRDLSLRGWMPRLLQIQDTSGDRTIPNPLGSHPEISSRDEGKEGTDSKREPLEVTGGKDSFRKLLIFK